MIQLIRSHGGIRLLIVALTFASLMALPAFTSTVSASRTPNAADPAAEVQAQAPRSCPPMIGLGSAGYWVRQLQEALNQYPEDVSGPYLDVDGIFGPKTERGVRTFQEWSDSLAVDGIVGPETWNVLGFC